MSTEIATATKTNVPTGTTVKPLMATDIDGAWRMATAFAQSGMLPKSYSSTNPIAAAFTAMQLGAEVGLTPMASIQNIAVVNGNPRIWGDAQLAIVRNSGQLEEFRETYEGKEYDPTYKAICTLKRKGCDPVTESFSVADATKAGLWGKQGPWTQYPKRMLKYRARAFALRDAFSDCLLGLAHTMEEEDVPLGADNARNVTPATTTATLDSFEEKFSAKIIDVSAHHNIIVDLESKQETVADYAQAAKMLVDNLERYKGDDYRRTILEKNSTLINEIYSSGLTEEAMKIAGYAPKEGEKHAN